ncbi:MAG TPA: hypothetical protein VL625_05775 [Patescibacteria group bacterium]|nr:hypothetical protein [Patescibacteria group bacterium]
MTMQTEDLKPDTPRNRGDYSAPHMSPITPAEDIRTVMLNRVSGSAVLIGTAMMLASQLILNLFGVGIGAAYAGSPSAGAATAQSMATLSLGALLWWTFSGILAAFIGGLTAGRLAGKPKESSAGWHGLGAWAVSVVVVAFLMAAGLGTMASSFRINNGNPAMQTSSAAYNGNGNASSPAYAGNSSTGSNASADMTGSAPETYGPGNTTPGGTNTGSPNAAGTGNPANTNMNGAPAGTSVQANNAPAATAANNAMNVDPRTAARLSIISAIGLLLGALAAWFGGWAGAVEPTMTDPLLRATGSSFHSL